MVIAQIEQNQNESKKLGVDSVQGISDKCGRESCRFNNTGKCTNAEQRNECLELLHQVIPDPVDRITLALSDQVIRD